MSFAYSSLFNQSNIAADDIQADTIITDSLILTGTSSQLTLNNTTLNDQSNTVRTITIPNTAGSSANFVLTEAGGGQIINGDLSVTGTVFVDQIEEYTTGTGVTINDLKIGSITDGLILADSLGNLSSQPLDSADVADTVVLRNNIGHFATKSISCRRFNDSSTDLEDIESLAIGPLAMENSGFAAQNIGIGYSSLKDLSSAGNGNIAIGAYSMSAAICSGNLSVGHYSLENTTGDQNTSIGHYAGRYSTGERNVFIGYNSFSQFGASAGNDIICIGHESGTLYNGSETNNILIGNTGVASDNNTIRLGNTSHVDLFIPLFNISGILHNSASGAITSSLITNGDIDSSAGIVYSKLNLSNSIVNGDINSSAGIVYSKLSLANSILNGDINSSAGIVYSKLNLSNGVVNADINSSAGITYSKLSLTNGIVNGDINSSAGIAYSKMNLSNSITNSDINTFAGIVYSKLNLTGSVVSSDINSQTSTAGQVLQSNGAGGAAWATISPSTNAATIDITNTSAGAAHYLTFVDNSGAGRTLRTDTSDLTYTPSTGVIGCSGITGYSTLVSMSAASGTLVYPCLSQFATGNNGVLTDTGLSFNPTTNALSTTTFAGDLNGTINTATTGTTQTAADNSTKIATTAYSDRVLANYVSAAPITLMHGTGWMTAGTAANTYIMTPTGFRLTTGSTVMAHLINIDSAEFPTVPGRSARLRISCIVAVNNTAPFTAGNTLIISLRPVTAIAGTTGNINFTTGADVSGSTITYTAPAANTFNNTNINFALPSNGIYAIMAVNSTAVLSGSNISVSIRLSSFYV